MPGAAPTPRLTCRAAAEGSGEEEPQLSEEQLKQMEEDFMKEFMDGMGADDPELKKYKSKVRPLGSGDWGSIETKQSLAAIHEGELKTAVSAPEFA